MVAATDPLRESHSETSSPNGFHSAALGGRVEPSPAKAVLHRPAPSGPAALGQRGTMPTALVPVPWFQSTGSSIHVHGYAQYTCPSQTIMFHSMQGRYHPMQAPNARRHKRAISEGWSMPAADIILCVGIWKMELNPQAWFYRFHGPGAWEGKDVLAIFLFSLFLMHGPKIRREGMEWLHG
ncbi:predicted protein [Histoplasma capsulatum G186AR]|uniref:Uncharacterized protein n=1 Tax=Ajellomyces capsulatus (strain G186AR / H82 / ATCC MYA-2454 / RMSCC 2432) TaxID=447093 RepID=C0P0B1_AJECG|nr:uncharacterized protein HCBG_08830 [Histoplasma capsulatum G186AR]EEH02927.1 predicted protein [Histoplasma capsulatum G186AR]